MAIFPKATRTSFARLLRKRGYTLPRNRELMFSNVGHGFFLMWEGPTGPIIPGWRVAPCWWWTRTRFS